MQSCRMPSLPGRRQEKHPWLQAEALARPASRRRSGARKRHGHRPLQPAGHGTRSGQFSGLRRQYRARSRNVLLRGRAHLDCVISTTAAACPTKSAKLGEAGRAILQDRQSAGRILPVSFNERAELYQLLHQQRRRPPEPHDA